MWIKLFCLSFTTFCGWQIYAPRDSKSYFTRPPPVRPAVASAVGVEGVAGVAVEVEGEVDMASKLEASAPLEEMA